MVGRPARMSVALQDVVRILALEPVEQCGKSVQMVEIFQHAEAIGLRQIVVRFLLRDGGGDLDRRLLVAERDFQRRMVGAQQPVDHRRLMLLDAAYLGQRHAQVRAVARGEMLEALGFLLDAVHQDHAYARERIVVELADWLARHFAPSEFLLVQRGAATAEGIECHGLLRERKAASQASRMPRQMAGCAAMKKRHRGAAGMPLCGREIRPVKTMQSLLSRP